MRATERHQRNGRGHNSGPEPRVVAVEYRPVPDGEARLRRIAAILLEHATRAASTGDDAECLEVQ